MTILIVISGYLLVHVSRLHGRRPTTTIMTHIPHEIDECGLRMIGATKARRERRPNRKASHGGSLRSVKSG